MRPQYHEPALYDPRLEHDACGVGFLAHLKGQASHAIVDEGLRALEKLEHRGATGAEADTGDGAGVLIQIPHRLFDRECALGRIESPEDRKPLASLPAPGQYAVGLFLGSQDAQASALAKLIFAMIVRQEGLKLLGWRRVPTDSRSLGRTARMVEPMMDHVFVAPADALDEAAFSRKLFVVRKRFQSTIKSSGIDDRQFFHLPTLSNKTLVYKGMLTPGQLRDYFSDLDDPRTESALCLFHSRFSTNTFPSWELAHPYRLIAHNGEINTLRGNVNWMRAREALLSSPLFGADLEKIFPIVHEGLSDSACLDSVLELLVMGGRSLPHAVMMLLPEAWEHDAAMSRELRAFYAYHGCLMEPWDGPACVCFTDGTQIGAVLDRNGLRPGRFWITNDDRVILASETGVLDVPPERIVEKGRLGPGRMFLLDLSEGRVVPDAEIKSRVATERPYLEWTEKNLVSLASLPAAEPPARVEGKDLDQALAAFGYTDEDVRLLLAPMATKGEEAIGSMGNDAALAILSDKPRSLFDYFQQLFAQVTNPPLDAIREKLVTSLGTAIGPEGNLLDPQPESCHLVLLESPFLDPQGFARLRGGGPHGVTVLDMTFPAEEGDEGLEPALLALFAKADNAIANGSKVLLLSDRGVSDSRAPIPSLLAVAGLHNHLVRERMRTRVTLIVETGEAREVHHAAMLIGYGASAICPYLALDALPLLQKQGLAPADLTDAEMRARYLAAIEKGVVKVMSKMGISTIASYRGAQIFEAVGLSKELVDRYFTLTPSRIGGVGAREIARDVLAHHARAYRSAALSLEVAGQYQWRRGGERHLFDPETVFKLQHATRTRQFEIFREYTRAIDESSERLCTLRGLLRLRTDARTPVPLDEVEPIESILPRFVTGAMSYGSISAEAHETLAIAMNRIGARSNSGEGGEDARRFVPDANGDSRRSAVKQVASARFGVTSNYLVNADELQIKIAQGAKPGEGGQLPGSKVYPWIAEVRHATPGVSLISPPPHHDIYSIEDLAQLIYDLRAANGRARISVKLVAEVGVGTVAAGVAKAKSDVVIVAGHDGGTGASPLTSVKHAGGPWELGLAEAQQTLVMNNLRDRVVLQVDGGMRTGRDVLVAALLGAEEFGFATAPLVVMGCVMMRVCHLDTCPVGIATQNPDLRARFQGRAEHVVSFFRFIAEEVRLGLAALGFRSLDEAIGRVDLLEPKVSSAPASVRLSLVDALAPGGAKARSIDFSRVLDAGHLAPSPGVEAPPALRSRTRAPGPTVVRPLDKKMLDLAEPALFYGEKVRASLPVTNQDRALGTVLGSEVTRRHGARGLPDGTIIFDLHGSAGQSLGAFLPPGITLLCEGDANDYVGKGLSGGTVAVFPPASARFDADKNVIAGNVILYGATSGKVFLRGRVGERFAVRNSGASAVVEGVGDHGCEYMTGGVVVVIGGVGRNFGAGMSGGVAYLLGEADQIATRVNTSMVGIRPVAELDLELIRTLVAEHAERTGSAVARQLLQGWDAAPPAFTKIISLDYEAAMKKASESRADTLQPPASARGVAAE